MREFRARRPSAHSWPISVSFTLATFQSRLSLAVKSISDWKGWKVPPMYFNCTFGLKTLKLLLKSNFFKYFKIILYMYRKFQGFLACVADGCRELLINPWPFKSVATDLLFTVKAWNIQPQAGPNFQNIWRAIIIYLQPAWWNWKVVKGFYYQIKEKDK